jgi:hypothetical protein
VAQNVKEHLDSEVALEEDAEEVETEEQLDPEVAARRAAALAHVRKFGDADESAPGGALR